MKLISIIAGGALLISAAQSEILESEWAILLMADSERLGIEMPEDGVDVFAAANVAKSLYSCMDVGYSLIAYSTVSDKRSDTDKKAVYEKFKQSFAYLAYKPSYKEFYSEKRLNKYVSIIQANCEYKTADIDESKKKIFTEVCVKNTIKSEVKEFIGTLNEYGNASLQYCSKYDQSN